MKNFFNRINKKFLLSLFALGGGIFYLKVFIPVTGIHIPCLFRYVTGLYCPGCGMTRASLSILDGDIYQSFRSNMLIFIILPLLAIFYVLEHRGKIKASRILIGFMVALTVIFGVLRNIEFFNWLAPMQV